MRAPGYLKSQSGRAAGQPRRVQAGCLGRQAPLTLTWFDLLDGEQLRLQTEKYLKQLPDVVSEPGFYNVLTG